MDGVAKRVIEELMTYTGHGGQARNEKPMRSSRGQSSGNVTDTSGPTSAGTYADTETPVADDVAGPRFDDRENERIRMPSMDDVAIESGSTKGETRSPRGMKVNGEAPSGDDSAGSGGASNRPGGR